MYTRQEAASLKENFWTKLGLYMLPIASAEGEKINWINYRTGNKHIYFRLYVEESIATISIEFMQPDENIRSIYFEQTRQLKIVLEKNTDSNWIWQQHFVNEHGKPIAKVFCQLENVSVFNQNDWPALITFFKTNLIALDQFWCMAKYSLEDLV